jgi:colanic acid/amylovoran biosynthesis protein
MRYHSNIFSAKMGVPFISISYEQKMQGFMTKAELNEYCIKISELSFSLLKVKFKTLENNYEQYRFYLSSMLSEFRRQSGETTNLICNLIASSEKN